MYQTKQLHIPVLSQQDMEIPKINLEENVLRMQNTSLRTRLDYYKQTIKQQKAIITELVEREIRHCKFFNCLETSWRGFLHRNMRIQSMLKKPCNLEQKYLNSFQYLDDIFNSQHLFANNAEVQFKKQISHKFDQFLRLVENIYFEISLQYNDFQIGLEEKSNLLMESMDSTNIEYFRQLTQLNKQSHQRNLEIQNNLKEMQKVREKKINDLDGQMAFQSIYQLQTLLGESKKINENLTRKLRIMNGHSEKPDDENNYECICGGNAQQNHKNNYAIGYQEIAKYAFESQDEKIIAKMANTQMQNSVNVNLMQQLLQRAVKNRTVKMNQVDEETYQIQFNNSEIKELENILMNYFSSIQKIDIISIQNKKYQQQVVALQQKFKELELRSLYREDQFVESETFKSLKIHNQNLIEQNGVLVQQLTQLQQSYQEMIHTRKLDYNNLQKYYENEISKLSTEVGLLQQKLNEKLQPDFHHQGTLDIEHLMSSHKERYAQQEKLLDALKNELKSQKSINKDLKIQLDDHVKQIEDLMIKLSEAENKSIELQVRIPDVVILEQVSFRHSKHKDFLHETSNIINKFQPQFKDKFVELVGYIKSRDGRVEHLEKEVQRINKQMIEKNKHQTLMVEDSEYNSKVYDEVHAKAKLVEQQLKVKEKNEAQLIQEKIAEKACFENERQQLLIKIKQQNELIQRFTNQISDQQQLLQKYSQEKFIKSDFNFDINRQFELQKQNYQKLEADYNSDKIVKDSLQQIIDKSSLINEEYLVENDKLSQKIIELDLQLQNNEKLLNDPPYLEQAKGYLILKKDAQITQDNLLIKLKTNACCTECKTQLKQVLLSKCMHMLCRDCGESAAFKGSCPVCQSKIHITDIWQVKMS